MCETCGCTVSRTGAGDTATVDVLGRLLKPTIGWRRITAIISTATGVLAFNLMSSPGAGKTALLEATIDALKARFPHRGHRRRSRDRQ